MLTTHYLRVARALALTAALPGCTSADDPTPPPMAASSTEADAGPELADAASRDAGEASHEEATDADIPFSSGPIVPPELTAGFA